MATADITVTAYDLHIELYNHYQSGSMPVPRVSNTDGTKIRILACVVDNIRYAVDDFNADYVDITITNTSSKVITMYVGSQSSLWGPTLSGSVSTYDGVLAICTDFSTNQNLSGKATYTIEDTTSEEDSRLILGYSSGDSIKLTATYNSSTTVFTGWVFGSAMPEDTNPITINAPSSNAGTVKTIFTAPPPPAQDADVTLTQTISSGSWNSNPYLPYYTGDHVWYYGWNQSHTAVRILIGGDTGTYDFTPANGYEFQSITVNGSVLDSSTQPLSLVSGTNTIMAVCQQSPTYTVTLHKGNWPYMYYYSNGYVQKQEGDQIEVNDGTRVSLMFCNYSISSTTKSLSYISTTLYGGGSADYYDVHSDIDLYPASPFTCMISASVSPSVGGSVSPTSTTVQPGITQTAPTFTCSPVSPFSVTAIVLDGSESSYSSNTYTVPLPYIAALRDDSSVVFKVSTTMDTISVGVAPGYVGCSAKVTAQGYGSQTAMSGQIVSLQVARGTSVTIEAIAGTNYGFSKWSDDVTTASRTFQTTEDATYEAIFYRVYHYELAFDATGGTGAPATRTADSNMSGHTFNIPSTEPTRTGYSFQGWTDYKSSTLYKYGTTHNKYTTHVMYNVLYAYWIPVVDVVLYKNNIYSSTVLSQLNKLKLVDGSVSHTFGTGTVTLVNVKGEDDS